MKKRNLVIVESPAKTKTLSKILGKDYILKASMGHLRDLPKSKLGVDVENDYAPQYVVPRIKSKIAKELREAAKKADMIYLATDPDREGEAIAWHLQQIIKRDEQDYRRVVFHEITKEAIENAFKSPRGVNMQLVNAQQARRVLDRLVGYKLSPLLWRKVRRGLSAGRVQSVALKIVVDREHEISAFKSEEYWTVDAELEKNTGKQERFKASLIGLIDGSKIAIHDQEESDEYIRILKQAAYSVYNVKTKKTQRKPAAPFITSTMQQEAWRKLRFSARQTMVIAQQLYEGLPLGKEGSTGLITYMRTDSPQVARQAVSEARKYIEEFYGAEYLPPHARTFTTRVKGAQEAHEAIRPTSIYREPGKIKSYLNTKQFKLYELIWKRMVASQMAVHKLENMAVDIKASHQQSKKNYLFHCNYSKTLFPGFIILYTEGRDTDDTSEDKSAKLPVLKPDDPLSLQELIPDQHFTQPPSRFTEASLVKALEQWGIGRPSTYATIMSTIQEREYVTKSKGSLKPTELGMVVSDLISKNFKNIVDVKFTARMEDELDSIANDNKEWQGVIGSFYQPFSKVLDTAQEKMERVKLPDEPINENCPNCNKPLVVKTGRFGKFIACSGYPECKYTRSYQVKTGVPCPEPDCDGEIIERRSKKGRSFYGCSKYPKCNFITNAKPLKQKCPKCGSLLAVYRNQWAKCSKCDYQAKLEEIEKETIGTRD